MFRFHSVSFNTWLFISGIVYICKGPKYPKLVLDNFIYQKHRKQLNNVTRWRCRKEKTTRCKAYLHTIGNTVTVNNHHNHNNEEVDPFTIMNQKFVYIRYSEKNKKYTFWNGNLLNNTLTPSCLSHKPNNWINTSTPVSINTWQSSGAK